VWSVFVYNIYYIRRESARRHTFKVFPTASPQNNMCVITKYYRTRNIRQPGTLERFSSSNTFGNCFESTERLIPDRYNTMYYIPWWGSPCFPISGIPQHIACNARNRKDRFIVALPESNQRKFYSREIRLLMVSYTYVI